MSFQITLAGREDDGELRRLVANHPVPGSPPVIYAREPDYFLGCHALGGFSQVIVAKDAERGTIAGVACRAVRARFVNGRREAVGYLGQLRVDDRWRGRWFLTRGYRFVSELHLDGRCRGYITTIVSGNETAERLLVTAARPSLPAYRFLDRIVAVLLQVPHEPVTDAVDDRSGRPGLDEVVHFVNEFGAGRQFYPVCDRQALAGMDVLVEGDLGAACGLWDQSAFKQTIVPGRGSLRLAYASFIAVRGGDAGAFDRLLDRVVARAARRQVDFVVVGLSARDPLLPVALRRPHQTYESSLYSVSMPDEGLHERF
jgi:hypothetical protein